MKKLLHFAPNWRAAGIALLCFTVPVAARARDHHDDHWDHGHHHSYSHPHFTLSFGTGWRGRGYYYGPPGVPYYYQAPGVVYYSSRAAVPSRYLVRGAYHDDSLDVAVQRALARRGYYRGPIDGDIGPGSRSAIARFQRDHGFAVTGTINSTLLHGLGIG
jgi:hypothetical protein